MDVEMIDVRFLWQIEAQNATPRLASTGLFGQDARWIA